MNGFDPGIGLVEQIHAVICRHLDIGEMLDDSYQRQAALDAAREIVSRLHPAAVWQARKEE